MHKLLLFCCCGVIAWTASAQAADSLKLEKTIALQGVKGKFDHFAYDEAGNRLFAAATGNQSVEVIDLASARDMQSITGLGKPHGLAWIADVHRLFVADGTKAELDVYEGAPLKLIKSIKLSEDADDMAYDTASRLLYVGHGGTDAANPASVAVVDVKGLAVVTEIPVAAHPEGLEFDATGQRIFVNISDTGEVVVIDGRTHAGVAKWSLKQTKGNTPLAYDAADNLLLLGCRTPAKVLALDGKDGREAGSAASSSGADDLFYEPATHHAYLITGSGSVETYAVIKDGKLQPAGVTHTVSGAKTGLLVPSRSELFVGVPGTAGPSELRVYKTSE